MKHAVSGMTEPIVPVKLGGEINPWWQQVVSAVRADGRVNVDADPDDAAKVAETLGLSGETLVERTCSQFAEH